MSKKNKKQKIANSKTSPPAKRASTHRNTQTVSTQEFYQGALPHPEHFARFEAICPGAAERILQLTELEQAAAHRQRSADNELREQVLAATAKDNLAKRLAAIFALLLCLLASVALAYMHATVAAAVVGGTTVVGVVATFLTQASSRKQGGRNG